MRRISLVSSQLLFQLSLLPVLKLGGFVSSPIDLGDLSIQGKNSTGHLGARFAGIFHLVVDTDDEFLPPVLVLSFEFLVVLLQD